MNKKKKKSKVYIPYHDNMYGFGSWLKDNSKGIAGGLKTVAGGALLATGVGAPLGVGLMASGISDIGQEIQGDVAAKKQQDSQNVYNQNMQQNQLIQNRLQQESVQSPMQFGKGGSLEEARYNKDVTYYGGGYTHEDSPINGTPIGSKGLVEKDEVRYKDYIFSNRF